MKILPTEVKLIAKLLDEPAEDANQLARLILTELETSRTNRKHYVVVVDDSGLVSTWGTYATIKEAIKQIGEPIIATRPGARALITLMHYTLPGDDDAI